MKMHNIHIMNCIQISPEIEVGIQPSSYLTIEKFMNAFLENDILEKYRILEGARQFFFSKGHLYEEYVIF